MGIVGKIRRLETKIARAVDAAVESVAGREPREPIEIVHAVLDAAAAQIQTAGRNRRVFPFNAVTVHVLAGSKAARARAAAVFDSEPSLGARIEGRLRDAGCEPPPVRVAVKYAAKPQAHWMLPECHVEFDREVAPEAPIADALASDPPRLDLTVVTGDAEKKSYAFTGGQINIGRRSDILDKRRRFLRVNHVTFSESESDINRSVSRSHAHIMWVPESGEYRVCDDRSAHGTSLIRGGRPVPVPGGSRGTRLQNGDEIVVGQARMKVRIAGG
jgi:hypothetical protein